MGHRSAEDYGKFALEAAKLMKWTDPSVKLIAAGSSNSAPGRMDRLEPHRARIPAPARRLSLAAHLRRQRSRRFRRLHGQLHGARPAHQDRRGHHRCGALGQPGNRKIYIAWDEWNVWYRARGAKRSAAAAILEEHYNLEDALVVATFLNSFLNTRTSSKSPTWRNWSTSSHPSSAMTRASICRPYTIRLALFANHCKGKALQLFVDVPKYKTRASTRSVLDASAAFDNGQLSSTR